MTYQLVVDTWESQGDIDEAVYKENNVAAIIVRLNDMRGGHHIDEGFAKQWGEAENFLRAPYFVYNPWKDAQGNFDWLIANCPAEAHTVLIDIEVTKFLYSKNTYAVQVDLFMDMVFEKWGTRTIYTGAWFLEMLAYWPQDADYWWAQYPFAFYQSGHMEWDEVRAILDEKGWREPFNADKIPGTYKMWQFTGDKLILPGNDESIDISLFPGTLEELATFLGYPEEVPEPPSTDADTFNIYGKFKIVNGWAVSFDSIQETGAEYTPDNPPPEADVTGHTLFPKDDIKFLRCFRTPDKLSEANKIQYWPAHGSMVFTAPLREYRSHAGNEVPNWTNSADEANLKDVWVRVYIQSVKKNNDKHRMLWPDWTTSGKEWDLYGCYALRSDLEALSAPIVEEPPNTEHPPYDPDFIANPPADPNHVPAPDWKLWMPDPLLVPHDGYEWVWMLPDDLSPEWNTPGTTGKTRQDTYTGAARNDAFPQTVKLLVPKEDGGWKKKELWMPFSEEWQWVVWRWTQLDSPQRSHNYHLWAFRKLLEDHKFATDLQDYELYTNYVLAHFIDSVKYNLARDEPFKVKISLGTGCNAMRGYKNGAQFIANAYDIHKPPTDPDAAYLERWRCHNATQIDPKVLPDRTKKVINFPMGRDALKLDGTWEKTRTSWPLIGINGEVGIDMELVRQLPNGWTYSTVNLERSQ